MRTVGVDAQFPGTAGARIVDVYLTHIAGPPCELDSTINLQLLESDGTLAAIEGNPSTYSVRKKTGLGELVTVGWYLGGEIRPTRQLTATARIDEWSATDQVRTPISDPQLGAGLSIAAGYPAPLETETSAHSYEAALTTTRAYAP